MRPRPRSRPPQRGDRRRRIVGVVIGAGVCVWSGVAVSSAITASNHVGSGRVGDGAGVINGYTLGPATYILNTNSPDLIDTVTFTLNIAPPSGSSIRTQLSPSGPWFACTNIGMAATCIVTAATSAVSISNSLRIVVAQ